MTVNSNRASGVFFIALGLFFLIYSFQYSFGTSSDMGPGFFPRIVSALVILLGLRTFFKKTNQQIKIPNLKMPVLIILITGLSGIIFKFVGAILAISFLLWASAFLHEKFNPKKMILINAIIVSSMIIAKFTILSALPL